MDEPIWIGGNDLATGSRWVWASNGYRIYPFTFWKAGYPEKSGSKHCMAMDQENSQWINLDCQTEAVFACEMSTRGFLKSFVFSKGQLSPQEALAKLLLIAVQKICF